MRNEENRFLSQLLPIWTEISDEILVLDDNSTDATRGLCESFGAKVTTRTEGSKAWGNEALARAELWEIGTKSECDNLLFLDADMVPSRTIPAIPGHSLAFYLYDLWSTDPLTYREDHFWQGHNRARLWQVPNPLHNDGWKWNARGLHCGHLPSNLQPFSQVTLPRDTCSLLHFSYSSPKLREEKEAKYKDEEQILTPSELAHASSITDAQPRTLPLPFTPSWDFDFG